MGKGLSITAEIRFGCPIWGQSRAKRDGAVHRQTFFSKKRTRKEALVASNAACVGGVTVVLNAESELIVSWLLRGGGRIP